MGKCLKNGKVVVILNGKYAGKKAVIVNVNETATNKHKFPHAVVCGIEKAPRKVTRSMKEDKINKKTHMKVFVKTLNLQHFMPTRLVIHVDIYGLDTLLITSSRVFLITRWSPPRRRRL